MIPRLWLPALLLGSLLFHVALPAALKDGPIAQLPDDPTVPIIKVHLVPHSHIDPGWLRTYEGYYPQVRRIFSNALTSLKLGKHRRFVLSEITYIEKYLNDPDVDDELKEFLRKAVLPGGQIELGLGAWVMPDESIVTYTSVLEALTLGHRYINETFGPEALPTTQWRIDSFGHSSILTDLYRLAGMKHAVLHRVPVGTAATMREKHTGDFWWAGLGGREGVDGAHKVLTTVLDYQYCLDEIPMKWFNEPSLATNEHSFLEKARQLADAFTLRMAARAPGFNQVMVTFGCDFSFDEMSRPEFRFRTVEPLLAYINEHVSEYHMRVRWSLPRDYFAALEKHTVTMGATFPLTREEFLPYTQGGRDWWTGYYSSWPAVKEGMVRLEAGIRNADAFCAFALAPGMGKAGQRRLLHGMDTGELSLLMTYAKKQYSLITHHDAVTGTSKKAVMVDYLDRLSLAELAAEESLQMCLLGLSSDRVADSDTLLQSSDDEGSVILFANSLSWDRVEVVRVALPSNSGQMCLDQLQDVESWGKAKSVFVPLPDDAQQQVDDLLWARVSLPSMGFGVFSLRPCSRREAIARTKTMKRVELSSNNADAFEYSAPAGTVRFDKNGDILSLGDVRLEQRYGRYTSLSARDRQSSGAYVFEPKFQRLSDDWPPKRSSAKAVVFEGPLLMEVKTAIDDSVMQTIRVFSPAPRNEFPLVEVEHTSGPIPDDVEIVTRFVTDSDRSGWFHYFYYSLNGLEERSVQASSKSLETIQQRYRPLMTTARTEKMAIVSSQAHGIASPDKGTLEVMLHRSPSKDDWKGMGEGLSLARDVANGRFRLFRLEDISDRAVLEMRFPIVPVLLPNVTRYGAVSLRGRQFVDGATFPSDLHLEALQLTSYDESETLMRLRRVAQQQQSAPTPVTSQLTDLFSPYAQFSDVREADITGLAKKSLAFQQDYLHALVGHLHLKDEEVSLLEEVDEFSVVHSLHLLVASLCISGAILTVGGVVMALQRLRVAGKGRSDDEEAITLEDFASSEGGDVEFDAPEEESTLNVAEIIKSEL